MPDTIEQLLKNHTSFGGFSQARVAMIATNPNLENNPFAHGNQACTRMTGNARPAPVGHTNRFLRGGRAQSAGVDLLHLGRGAAGSFVTIDVPVGATLIEE